MRPTERLRPVMLLVKWPERMPRGYRKRIFCQNRWQCNFVICCFSAAQNQPAVAVPVQNMK